MTTSIQSILKEMHKDFASIGTAAATQGRKGDELKAHVVTLHGELNGDETATVEAVTAFVQAELSGYLSKHPKPDAKSDTPEYKTWNMGVTRHVHNPVRSIAQAFTDLKIEKRIVVKAAKGAHGEVSSDKPKDKAAVDQVDVVVKAIEKLEKGFSQANANKLLAAMKSKGFTLAQMKKFVEAQ